MSCKIVENLSLSMQVFLHGLLVQFSAGNNGRNALGFEVVID
jgi:hypothetical protein